MVKKEHVVKMPKTYTQTSGRIILAISRVFQQGKTQIPRDVRKELDLKDGDKILWLWENGKIIVEKISYE